MRTRTWTRMICSVAALACVGLANAQSFPRANRIPPRGPRPAVAAVPATSASSSTASPWEAVNNKPPFTSNSCNGGFPGASDPLLLTDGTVIVQDAGCSDWLRLTPDKTGSYANGTWTQIASLPPGYAPLYHSSAVLPDGRVIIMGGEYNFVPGYFFFIPRGRPRRDLRSDHRRLDVGGAAAVLHPTQIPPFPLDADDRRCLRASSCRTASTCSRIAAPSSPALLDAKTLTWTPTGAGKFDDNDEEGWNLLPNGEVLTVDAYVPVNFPYIPTGTNSELYDYRTGTWRSAGSTIVQLWDSGLYVRRAQRSCTDPHLRGRPGGAAGGWNGLLLRFEYLCRWQRRPQRSTIPTRDTGTRARCFRKSTA